MICAVVTLIRQQSVSTTRPSTDISFCSLSSFTNTLSGRMQLKRIYLASNYTVIVSSKINRYNPSRERHARAVELWNRRSAVQFQRHSPAWAQTLSSGLGSTRPYSTDNVEVRAWFRRCQSNIGPHSAR